MSQNNNTEIMDSYLTQVGEALTKLPIEKVKDVVKLLDDARTKGKRVFILGNGGSAATASHFACDLAKGAIVPGQPRLRAIALTESVPLISAWSNDSCYENMFSEQLTNWMESEDIIIGISGSGNSPNVLNAMRTARSAGALTIAFTGFNGGKIKHLADLCIIVSSYSMEQVEDIHLLLCHLITVCLRTGELTEIGHNTHELNEERILITE